MSIDAPLYKVELAGPDVAELGESPLWHPQEQCLYYVDIPGRQVLRLARPGAGLQRWDMPAEPGCIAALEGGGLLVAARDGLWRLDTASGALSKLAPPPYDSARQRFNDGKPDALGRLWVGTIDDRRQPDSALWRFDGAGFASLADGITTSNGLAWSPDQRTLYWSDTRAHRVYAFDFDLQRGAIAHQRVFAEFTPRAADQPLDGYGGRPDGATVDVQGCYWVAMFEGQRLNRFSPAGQLLGSLPLPVRCPTMPTFGDADLRTLYITTAREGRPEAELQAQPWAGCVLRVRVDVPGLPAHLARA